jgi:hypothetical protein
LHSLAAVHVLPQVGIGIVVHLLASLARAVVRKQSSNYGDDVQNIRQLLTADNNKYGISTADHNK